MTMVQSNRAVAVEPRIAAGTKMDSAFAVVTKRLERIKAEVGASFFMLRLLNLVLRPRNIDTN